MFLKHTLIFLAGLLGLNLSMAIGSVPLPAVASLVAAESEFAAHAVATDMRQAFIRALGSDGILLRPTAVLGRHFMQHRPIPAIELNWRPSFAYVAASGDVGVSSGPWRILSKTNPAAAPTFGHFVSIWKRQTDGRWSLAFDTGIGHPQASFADAFLETPPVSTFHSTDAKIASTMTRFVDAVATGDYNTAVQQFAAADIKVFRDGLAPIRSKAAMGAMQNLPPAWKNHLLIELPIASAVASTKDFAYRLFEVRVGPTANSKLVAHTLTVWRATASGDIELMLDIVTDMPTQK